VLSNPDSTIYSNLLKIRSRFKPAGTQTPSPIGFQESQ
jgi:hypothetical protein